MMLMIVSFWGKGDSAAVREEFLSVIKGKFSYLTDTPVPRIKNDKLRCAVAISDLTSQQYDVLTELATTLDSDAIVRWV